MIEAFCKIWSENENILRERFLATEPSDYGAIVTEVVTLINECMTGYDPKPHPKRITVIDHGDYHGTKLYVIGAEGYQPSTYWSVFVDYGTCTGCDAIEKIRSNCRDGGGREQLVKDYMSLALHILQSMRQITGDRV